MPLRAYAAARDFTIVEEYVDLGWSGGKERRPQLDRMMADAKHGRFDAVMVWKFDRFARSTRHLLSALAEFESLAMDFLSLSEAIDTSTPMGKMVFTIMGAVAEMERALIRERVLAGVDRARRQGKTLGRPRAIVDEVKVCERVASGQSVKSVAKEAGIAQGTVVSIIRRHGLKKAINEPLKSPLPEAM